MILRHTATERDRGRTVLSILRGELMLSASLIRRLKRSGGITVSGVLAFTDRVVVPGETVEADLGTSEAPASIPIEHGELTILYETEGLIAAAKPAGMLTHPSRARYTGTLANYIAGYLLKNGAAPVCHAVNRLDRDTSGVVLFAKNAHVKTLAAAALSGGINATGVKEYLALAEGVMSPERGTIDKPIRRVREGDMLRAVLSDGQRAVTHYETLRTQNGASLLRLRLETGRTHQIRVHLFDAGHPVLGDGLYYTESSRKLSDALGIVTQALHAYRLGFRDPMSGEAVELLAEAPWWGA